MARQDQYSVTLVVAGRETGVWDKMEGGEFDSDEVKYREGNMGPQVSLGGPTMVGNITLTRLFKRGRDAQDLIRFLFANAGSGDCTVKKQPLDKDGNANVRPLVYNGTLKTVTPGPADSGASDADTYEVVISSEGSIA